MFLMIGKNSKKIIPAYSMNFVPFPLTTVVETVVVLTELHEVLGPASLIELGAIII